MPLGFVGRVRELGLLHKRLDRVGKSPLVQEFCDQAELPYVYSTATTGASPVASVSEFLSDLAQSSVVTDRELVPENSGGS